MSKPIHQEISFNTNPKRIYEALTNAKQFSELTGAPAKIDSVSGVSAGANPKINA